MKARNGYAHGKVESVGRGQKPDLRSPKVKTSHDDKDDSPKYKPDPNKKHGGFQLGNNPMDMTEFEKRLILQEKKERQVAKERYVAGIQGTDGGKKPYECYNPNN